MLDISPGGAMVDHKLHDGDLIVRRNDDGRWSIHQRRGSFDALIRGPFVTRADALEPAHTLTEALGCHLFIEVTPGILEKER
jgi:hypothetical protein